MNTFSFCSSSSAKASFRASRTVISLTPLGVAYLRLFAIDGKNEAVGESVDRAVAETGREEINLEVGRNSRKVAAITGGAEKVELGSFSTSVKL